MKDRSELRLAALAFVMLLGCHGSGSGETGNKDAGASDPSAIGVAECDDYVTKVERCIQTRVPSERKQVLADSLHRTRTSWQTLAGNPGARPGLGQACQLALKTAQTTMKEYACSW